MRKLILAAIAVLLLPAAVIGANEGGAASWFDDGPGLYAAVPSYRWGDPRYRLTVCTDPTNCVTVTVRDHCNCYVGTSRERLIDLSPAAFAQLAPLSRGLIQVYIQTPQDGPKLTPPPTNTSTGQVLWSGYDRSARVFQVPS